MEEKRKQLRRQIEELSLDERIEDVETASNNKYHYISENSIQTLLDRAREEGKRMVYEAIVYDENIPHEVTTFVAANLWKNMRDKAKEELSKLTTK